MTGQGGSRLVAMVQHPSCLFAYWELAERDLAALERTLNARREALGFALRLYRLGDAGPAGDAFDTLPVELADRRRYIHGVSPGRLYWLELGVQAEDGGFLRLLRSNIVETPPGAPATGDALMETGAWTYSPLAATR